MLIIILETFDRKKYKTFSISHFYLNIVYEKALCSRGAVRRLLITVSFIYFMLNLRQLLKIKKGFYRGKDYLDQN